jgi:hypothetical protein
VARFTVAEDIVQSDRNDVESAVQVLRLDGSHGEAFVEALKELRQELVAGLHIADVGKSQFLDQTVLEGTVTRSTRPLARLEFAQMISMFSSANARPNCVIPEPPLASGLFTRKTVCLSE